MKTNHYNIYYLIFILIQFFTTPSTAQIILSEVMFDPIESEYYDEFVEIYNVSCSDTIDLTDWQISDSSEADFIIPYLQGMKIKPQQFGIILDSGYFQNSHQYDNLIPHDALVLTIDDASFGSQGLSNSVSEPIILISGTGDTIAKYHYSIDNPPGYSDEKRYLSEDDSPANWSNSKFINGTPGSPNSVSQLLSDVSLELLGFPPTALPGQSVTLIAAVTNVGISNASHILITFYEDVDNNSLLSFEEQLCPTVLISDTLTPGENHQIRTVVDSLSSGAHFFYATAYFQNDEDTLNNIAAAAVKIGFLPKTLIINEIMYRPSVGEAEWIELYNPGDKPVNISQWQLSDVHTDKRVEFTDSMMIVPGKCFIVIAKDSTVYDRFPDIPGSVIIPAQGFPALNNNEDDIHIFDLIGTVIDRVSYKSSWGSKSDVSLERRWYDGDSNDPSNWMLSQHEEGGTPGFRNSVAPKDHDLGLIITVKLNYPDSISLSPTIYNGGLLSALNFRCDLYLDRNLDSLHQDSELITTISQGQKPLLPNDSIRTSYQIFITQQGINRFIANLIYDLDEDQSNNKVIDQVIIPFNLHQLVINEIMFRPLSGNPEWIELVNPGSDSINLFRWKFSDSNVLQKPFITERNLWIKSKSYLLLAESEDIFTQLLDTLFKNIIIPISWPTLNNNSDQVLLYDLTDKTIDSLFYFSHWDPNPGVSLERIDFLNFKTDSSNWAASHDTAGSTPGQFNSVSPVDYDLAVTGINYTPQNPFPDQEIAISICIKNVGRLSISACQLSCFVDHNHNKIFESQEQLGETIQLTQVLQRGETVTIPLTYIPLQSGRFDLGANIAAEQDFKLANNWYSVILSIGFERQALVINEIMYSPSPGQAEWIELFNPTDKNVDLQNWKFSDSDSSQKRSLTADHILIDPNTFLILASDSSLLDIFNITPTPMLIISEWQGLNNDFDNIFMFDANNNIIDNLRYTNNWGGNQGISLERINPLLSVDDSTNWNSCVAMQGGTPGRKNSIYVEVLPTEEELTILPNPFSPDEDGHDDFTIISYQLPFNLSHIHIKIFDIRGRLVRFLANNRPSGITGSIIWDGRDDQGNICRMGIYLVYLEAIHYQKGVVKSLKKSVVLAKQL